MEMEGSIKNDREIRKDVESWKEMDGERTTKAACEEQGKA